MQTELQLPLPKERMEVVNENKKVITDPCGCRFFYVRASEDAEWKYAGGEDCGIHFTNYAHSI